MLTINVRMLDGEIATVQADRKDKGEVVFDKVCQQIELAEKDYFGLQYEDKTGVINWVELDKRLGRLFKADQWQLQFAVKFYPPDPSQLQEDVTRYQLTLQIRNDILSGKLECSLVTHALLGSYLVQAQIGDFEPDVHTDTSYLQGFRFAPKQTQELEAKVMELHKTHKGQMPAEAELNYLENAKKHAMYGVDTHYAKDSEGVEITIGVCSTGIFVLSDRLRINRFAWPKILKISYKRNHFYVKIRPGDYEQYESTIGFKLDSHRAAKRLWKVCVEHHTFFRLMTPEDVAKPGLFPRLSSNFRYSRRTQAMLGPIDRRQPTEFRKSLRNKELPSSKSLDPLVQQQSNQEDGRKDHVNKRNTMPPQSDIVPMQPIGQQPSPVKKEKGQETPSSASSEEGDFSIHDKERPKGVKVLPDTFPKKNKISDQKKENGIANESDEEKENRQVVSEDPNRTSSLESHANKKKTKSPSQGFSFFSKLQKSEKKKESESEGKNTKAAEADVLPSKKSDKMEESGVTVEYSYEEVEDDSNNKKKKSPIKGGFSYEARPDRKSEEESNDAQSPVKKNTALAFNYAPGQSSPEKIKVEEIKMEDSLKRKDTPREDDEKKGAFVLFKKKKSKDAVKEDKSPKKEEDERDKKKTRQSLLATFEKKDKNKRPGSPQSDDSLGKIDKDKSGKKRPGSPDSDSSLVKKSSSGKLDKKNKSEKQKSGLTEDATVIQTSESAILDTKNKSAKKRPGSPDHESVKPEKKDKSSKKKSEFLESDNSANKELPLRKSDKTSDPHSNDFTNQQGNEEFIKEESKKSMLPKEITEIKGGSVKKDNKDTVKSKWGKDKGDKKKEDKHKEVSPKSSKPSKWPWGKSSGSDKSSSAKKADEVFDKENKQMPKLTIVEDATGLLEQTKSQTLNQASPASTFSPEYDGAIASAALINAETGKGGPKIVKTTTKQSVVKGGGNVTHNIEEKIEDLGTGDITLNTAESLLEDSAASPYVTATAVTTRTAMTTEDLGTNAKTSQVEEKTVARTTTHSATRQEQRVVTQQVTATSTILPEPQQQELTRRHSLSSTSSDDSGTPIDGDTSGSYYTNTTFQEPIVETEAVFLVSGKSGEPLATTQAPLVTTSPSLIGPPVQTDTTVASEIVSSQTITSKTRTVETVTYKTEKDGVVETRVEQKITIQSDGDPIDHDKALAEAIQEATAMNPDMQVEKIEIQQESVPK